MRGVIRDFIIIFLGFIIRSKKSKIIYYHDLHQDISYTGMSTHIDIFKKHMNILKKKGYKIVKCIENKEREIKICFDDGFKGIYDFKDFFVKEKIFVEVFLITSMINEDNYLDIGQIHELLDTGFFSFGSHTHNHKNLGDISNDEMRCELKKSKEIIDDLLKIDVKSICFPRGIFSDEVIRISEELGYNEMFSSIPGNYYDSNNLNIKYRYLVQNIYRDSTFEGILRGGVNIFKNYYYSKHYRV